MLDKILTLDAKAVDTAAAQLEINWEEEMQRPDAYIKKMDAALTAAGLVQDRIAKLLTENSSYRAELEPPVGGGKEASQDLSQALLDVRELVDAPKNNRGLQAREDECRQRGDSQSHCS
jgi:hypothetical protein